LVVGLGNPILGDDGVGWRVAEEVSARLRDTATRHPLRVERLSVGGLALMERMVGYSRAILIDSITEGDGSIGSLTCLPLSAFPDHSAGHLVSAHDTSLQNALAMGRQMGLELPSEVWVVGIRAVEVRDFSERLSPAIREAVPGAAEVVLNLISNGSEEAARP
jgi:hydrogenase maturation protease